MKKTVAAATAVALISTSAVTPASAYYFDAGDAVVAGAFLVGALAAAAAAQSYQQPYYYPSYYYPTSRCWRQRVPTYYAGGQYAGSHVARVCR